jgi:hypothetical protein
LVSHEPQARSQPSRRSLVFTQKCEGQETASSRAACEAQGTRNPGPCASRGQSLPYLHRTLSRIALYYREYSLPWKLSVTANQRYQSSIAARGTARGDRKRDVMWLCFSDHGSRGKGWVWQALRPASVRRQMAASFLPTLTPQDVEQAIQVIRSLLVDVIVMLMTSASSSYSAHMHPGKSLSRTKSASNRSCLRFRSTLMLGA